MKILLKKWRVFAWFWALVDLIRGEKLELDNEFLINRKTAEKVYQGHSIDPNKHTDFGYFILVSVAGVGCNDSVVAVAKVWGKAQWGEQARRTEVLEIPLCTTSSNLGSLVEVIKACKIKYSNATVLVNPRDFGGFLALHLKELGIPFEPVHWGASCFSNKNRKEYVNKRAQAYVELLYAIKQDRLKICTSDIKLKIEEQLTHIPYKTDSQNRIKILTKAEMLQKGITPPDVVDTISFIFLEGMNYKPAYKDGISKKRKHF